MSSITQLADIATKAPTVRPSHASRDSVVTHIVGVVAGRCGAAKPGALAASSECLWAW